MASRKDDEAHHPGSYVQVVGTPRKRKASAAKQAITEVNSSAVERVSVPAGRYRLDSSTEQSSGQQDHAAERVFSPPRRAQHGPLGMEEKREQPKAEPSKVSTAKTTAIGLGPDLRADIAAAQAIIDQQRAERAREMLSESQPMPTERFERAQLERVQKAAAERVRVREISEAATDPSQESARERVREPAFENSAPAVEMMRAPSLSPAQVQPQQQMQSLARVSDQPPAMLDVEKELPSLLSVRPSLSPSDPAPAQRQGASIAMVVGIAVLSSIIAAAGVVALQEVFHRRDSRMAEPLPMHAPARSAAPVETSHHAARSEPVAEPALAAPAAAVAAPAPAPVAAEPVAAEPAPAPAPVAVPAARVARPLAGPRPLGAARPAVAAPVRPAVMPAPVAKRAAEKPSEPKNRVLNGDFVAPGSGAALGGDPSDPLPSNPY